MTPPETGRGPVRPNGAPQNFPTDPTTTGSTSNHDTGRWLDNPDLTQVNDKDLVWLVRRLDRAVRAASRLPGSATIEDLRFQAARARLELRQRQDQDAVRDGFEALRRVTS